jgi:hypothetical protein
MANASSYLALQLDQEMIERTHGIPIASRVTNLAGLPPKTGVAVSAEIGGRYLLRYLMDHQMTLFNAGSQAQHWVTPTPVAPQDASSILFLPQGNAKRRYALLLDPNRIDRILGPHWVVMGQGIEYLLPDGFPLGALATPWPIEVR